MQPQNEKIIGDPIISLLPILFSKAAIAPIDRIRFIFQTQQELLLKEKISQKFSGLIGCFKYTVKNEGYKALFRGYGVSVLKIFPATFVNPSLTAIINSMFHKEGRKKSERFFISLISGFTSTITTAALLYPLEFSRIRLAIDLKKTKESDYKFKGGLDLLFKIYKSDGIKGIYRGFGLSLIGIASYRGILFGFYENSKNFLPVEYKKSLFANIVISYSISFFAGFLVYPFETVKNRLLSRSGELVKYTSYSQAFGYVYRIEGFRGFYKGLPLIYLSAITSAVSLIAIENLIFVLNLHNF